MQISGTWKRLITARRRSDGAGLDEGEAPATRELRQRCLGRLLQRGMPLWSQEPEHCDACGRELLLGERALLLSRDDELLLACALCTTGLRDQGYRTVTANTETDAVHGRGASLDG